MIDNYENIDITAAPPADEAERQFYYIKKAREYVKKKSEELGRPLFAKVETFGCQMNAASVIEKTP